MKVEIHDFTDKLIKSLNSGSVSAMDKSTNETFDAMQSACPILTGNLKSTGHVVEAKRGSDEVYSVIEYSAPYSIFAEYKRMWMRRTASAKMSATMENFGDIG